MIDIIIKIKDTEVFVKNSLEFNNYGEIRAL